MRTRGWWATLVPWALAWALACGSDAEEGRNPDAPAGTAPDAGPPAAAIEGVELVDSIPWTDELGGGMLHRVAVRRGGSTDTIPAITTDQLPRVVGDSLVTGFARADGRVSRGFVYDPARRRVESVPLPDDFAGFLAHSISPDGRWMAYVGKRADGSLDANVVRWPSGAPVHESGPVEGYPSDARNSRVQWSGDAVEIHIRLPVIDPDSSTWLVVAGDPGTGSFSAHTVVVAER